MHTVARISILCLIIVGSVSYGQDDFFEVFDFDTFGSDFEEPDLINDREDIFKEKPQNTDVRLSSDALKNLCDEYEVLLDNEKIDCSRIKLNQKLPNLVHNIQKRQAEETELEGSGAGYDAPNPEENEQEPPNANETPEEPKEQEPNPPAGEPELNPVDFKEGEPNEQGIPVEEAVIASNAAPMESAADVPAKEDTAPVEQEVTEAPVNEDPQPEEAEPPAKEEDIPAEGTTVGIEAAEDGEPIIEDVNKPEEAAQPTEKEEVGQEEAIATTVAIEPAQDKEIEEAEPEESQTPTVREEPTTVGIEAAKKGEQNAENQDATTTSTGLLKKGRKLLPGDSASDKSQKTTADETPKENVQENQSGNAVVESPEGSTMEQHEGVIKSMAASANIKEGASSRDEPKSGESAKEADEGRKDTKVLVILFVAVVVVGAAAFAYNFIKKRKQKNATVEQNGDGRKTSPEKSDPEHGTEMKPLMRPAAEKQVVAEYKDEKENK